PYGIRKHLKLDRPIYRVTANYGHFGRDVGANGEFSWEKTDLIDELLHNIKA
ncbi:MAG: methionine adenosyltransferase domain-containing protein, partial [Alphaproteobacteria bacterium]|nr:methionine adenosyltransferase domain-containing protein [Alphaproteobacteria bacterium]